MTVKNPSEALGLLLDAITKEGELQPTDFRAWSENLKRGRGYESLITLWFKNLADTLEELGVGDND